MVYQKLEYLIFHKYDDMNMPIFTVFLKAIAIVIVHYVIYVPTYWHSLNCWLTATHMMYREIFNISAKCESVALCSAIAMAYQYNMKNRYILELFGCFDIYGIIIIYQTYLELFTCLNISQYLWNYFDVPIFMEYLNSQYIRNHSDISIFMVINFAISI